MRILFFLIFISLSTKSFSQNLHSIRFVFFGHISKPIGTRVISVEKIVNPTDRITDKDYGKAMQTDLQTFGLIEKLCSKYKANIISGKEYDIVFQVLSGECQFLLEKKSLKLFREELELLIKRDHLDVNVLFFLDYYPWP